MYLSCEQRGSELVLDLVVALLCESVRDDDFVAEADLGTDPLEIMGLRGISFNVERQDEAQSVRGEEKGIT